MHACVARVFPCRKKFLSKWKCQFGVVWQRNSMTIFVTPRKKEKMFPISIKFNLTILHPSMQIWLHWWASCRPLWWRGGCHSEQWRGGRRHHHRHGQARDRPRRPIRQSLLHLWRDWDLRKTPGEQRQGEPQSLPRLGGHRVVREHRRLNLEPREVQGWWRLQRKAGGEPGGPLLHLWQVKEAQLKVSRNPKSLQVKPVNL